MDQNTRTDVLDLLTRGLLALASSKREPARQSFGDALRSELEMKGVRLVSAQLGRQRGVAVWVVTSELGDGRMVRVVVPVQGPPYEDPQAVALGVAQALHAA